MGSFAAVAQGADEEPALITIRYEGPDASGPVLGLVGKAVTFDTGGISIKTANKMFEMKFDMSGGAAVLGAVEAIAKLRLPIRIIAVVGATENMPSGHAMRPGDVVRASNDVTIEIINTDAEGRLVLADCLAHAVAEGAERLVDIATLTGAVIGALGNTHAGVFGKDDDWVAQVSAAGTRPARSSGACRSTPTTAKALDSDTADLMNVNEARKAGSSVAARSSAASPATSRGRTSTSPAPPGAPASRTRRRAAAASACGCSWSSRARSAAATYRVATVSASATLPSAPLIPRTSPSIGRTWSSIACTPIWMRRVVEAILLRVPVIASR